MLVVTLLKSVDLGLHLQSAEGQQMRNCVCLHPNAADLDVFPIRCLPDGDTTPRCLPYAATSRWSKDKF